jgi:hypothetical protein
VLDRELEELWRMQLPHYAEPFVHIHDELRRPTHTPFYIMDVAMSDEYYYVVSINYMREDYNINHQGAVSPSSSTVTVVYKVDRDGNIVDIFRRENFEFLGLKIQDGFYIMYGIQLTRDRAETIVMYGSSDDIFSEEYTVIQGKNLIRNVMIANDVLVISGELVHQPAVRQFITLIDLNSRNIMKTLDVSEIRSNYEVVMHGILYGENQDRIGIIGTSTWPGSKLGQEENSIVFIPVSNDFEVNSAYVIDVGNFHFANISDICVCEKYFTILGMWTYISPNIYPAGTYYIRDDIIDFSLSHEQLMGLQ